MFFVNAITESFRNRHNTIHLMLNYSALLRAQTITFVPLVTMKKQSLQILGVIFCLFIISACAKKEDSFEPDTSGNTENPADNKGSFIWTTSSSQSVTADSAFYYSQFTTIYAFKNGNANSIEMNLSALSLGTYSFSSTSGNTFAFVDGSTNYTASSGAVTITAVANNRLSGSYSTNLVGGAITSLNGTFTDIKKK
jgi:hypothetical protein